MELELTEDDLHSYQQLASEPGQYEDQRFLKSGLGPNPLSLVASVLLVVLQYALIIYLVRQDSYLRYYFYFTFIHGISLVLMYLLNKSNPGVVKRNTDLQAYLSDAAPATVAVLENHRFIQRWCVDCRIYKPPRVKHCYECGSCIARFDHHCQWLSNCIGHNNYKLFITFVAHFVSSMLFTVLYIAYFIRKIGFFKGLYYRLDLWLSFAVYEKMTFLILVFFVISAAIGAYSILVHLYFIAKNMTYYEYVSNPYGGTNPFDRGALENLLFFFRLPLTLDG
ncbi:zinc finger DHHC domain containing protein [Babesia gibsoni]|uniref:Palmitoyltransferase n=1 Tax=Babesia gibsoni TaxID=33632 RepID=A0AAD8LRD5_BABGI|nr:zinc finger DHHC domain containing protein [Babesia gibsoni]